MSTLHAKKSARKVSNVTKTITRTKVRGVAEDVQRQLFKRARTAFWLGIGVAGALFIEEQIHQIKHGS
jgi:hypothetical protein